MSITPLHEPTQALGAGQVWRLDDDTPTSAACEDDFTFSVLQLPLSMLTEGADETTDTGGTGVRFLSAVPVDEPAQCYWAGLTGLAHQQAFAAPSPLGSSLIRAHLIETLIGAALRVFPNTTMTTDYLPGPGRVGPATVRRALAHLHAHAGTPVSVGQLAGVPDRAPASSAAGASPSGPTGGRRACRRHRCGHRRPLGLRPPRPVRCRLPAAVRHHPCHHAAHLNGPHLLHTGLPWCDGVRANVCDWPGSCADGVASARSATTPQSRQAATTARSA